MWRAHMDEQRKDNLSAEADGIIEGRNAVIEALRAGTVIDKIYLQKGETDKTLGHIASKARAAGVVLQLRLVLITHYVVVLVSDKYK